MSERNYKQEYQRYQGTPEQIRKRTKRNAARRLMLKKGRVCKGQDVDHKDGDPMNNASSNLRPMSPSKNRAKH